jgi:hypothetical protein
MVDEWFKKLIFPGDVKDFIKSTKDFNSEGTHHKEYVFYTDEYKYRIVAIDRPDDDGYLGCGVSARKARPGEDWRRGNDLPDGTLNEESWLRILNAIINYELVELSQYKRPDSVPE